MQSNTEADEEQQLKLQEIVELLLASGYFRARIKGLSSFDKVVGGMVWCISVCSFEIDVDIFFKENSTIGQKIALTEKLVECLRVMSCPHPLQPHQIQGLDFRHIFPVVQWLVKRAVESRRGGADARRLNALHHFSNSFDVVTPKRVINRTGTLTHLQTIEGACERRWRLLHGNAFLGQEEKRIRSVLLEYGRNDWIPRSNDEDAKGTTTAAQETSTREKEVEEMMKRMTLALPAKDDVHFSILNEALQQIHSVSSHYAALQTQLEEVRKEEMEVKEPFNKLLHERQRLVALEEELQRLEESANDQSGLARLNELARRKEELKNEEKQFRLQCEEEKKSLQAAMDALKVQENSSDQTSQLSEVEEELEGALEKLSQIRKLLAKKNRETAGLQMGIDEVPSRVELSQYQARFIELHNQMAQKHKETKQFFNLHNTAEDVTLYLDKEVNLLNSIYDTFEKGMSSEAGKEAFMQQLNHVVGGVLTNKKKIESKLEETQARVGVMEADRERFQRMEDLYYAAVKAFQEECGKQEILLGKLKQLTKE